MPVSALEDIGEGVIVADARGRITFVNAAAERLLSCRRDRCQGEMLTDALPGQLGPSARQHCRRAARSGSEAAFEFTLDRGRPIAVRVCPHRNGGGATLCLTDLTRQRAAEAALRQSEERFGAIVEHAPVGIEQVAIDNGALLQVNAYLCDLLGYQREELLRTTFAAITHPDDLRLERKLLRSLVRGQTSSYAIEKRYRRRSGEWVWVRVSSAVYRASPANGQTGNGRANGYQPYRIAIVQDISDARRAAEERGRLAAIVESSDDAILSEDLSGTIQTWNPGAERLFGYAAAEIVGRPISTIIPPERAAEEQQFFVRIRRGRPVDHFETIRRHKSGRSIQVSLSLSPLRDASGRIVGAAKIARDVGERNRQQQALRESEARTRAIIETAIDAIVLIDERGLIESVNPATERLFGYRAQELLGRNVSMLMPEPYRSEHDHYLASYMETGHARIIGIGREVTGKRKDGSTFPLSLAVAEVRLGDRRMFTGIVHDLTARRRLEREVLEAATDEQRRIGQDLHDGLCQELVGLSISTELLAQALDGSVPQQATRARELGDEIRSAADQARRLAHGLNPVDVEAGGLPGALEQLARRVTKTTGLQCQFAQSDEAMAQPEVAVATHLFRIAQEAVSNAVKHAKARRIEVVLRSENNALVLQVADDGTGIAPASDRRITRVLHAPPPPAPTGAGIGLRTMSYRARMIGGDLTIGPGRRGGTVVTCSVRLSRTNPRTRRPGTRSRARGRISR